MLDCVIDRKVRDVIFEAILSPSERYQNIQDNPEYNIVLPFRIILKIFTVNVLMKIDIGTSTSLIKHNTFIKLLGNASKLTSTSSRIGTYTAEVVKTIGDAELKFTYNNQKAVSSVIIMRGSYLNLLGRDILRKIKLNWEELFKYDNREETVKLVDDINLNNIRSRYRSTFDKELGTLKNEVTVKVKSDAILK